MYRETREVRDDRPAVDVKRYQNIFKHVMGDLVHHIGLLLALGKADEIDAFMSSTVIPIFYLRMDKVVIRNEHLGISKK